MNEPDWFVEAKRIAEEENRDLSFLASYMDPDPDKYLRWAFEPCARSHDPYRICVLPNGHVVQSDELSDEEAADIDRHMDDHMYHHSISNNINSMGCDVGCRTRALKKAFNQVLKKRRE